MKNILFILFLISFTGAHAKNFCDTYLGTEVNPDLDQTDQYISYLGKLYDEGVLSAQDLNDMIVESNKANQLINPLAKATHSVSARLAHFENLAWYLKNTPIDKKKVLDWAQKIQEEIKVNIVRREKAQEQTIATDQKMIFYSLHIDVTQTYYNKEKRTTYDFEMMSTKVTQKMWVDLMGKNPSYNKGKGIKPNHPVENITWWSAAEFANRLSIQHGFKPVYALDKIVDWEGSAEEGTLKPQDELKALKILKLNYPNKNVTKAEGYRIPTHEEYDQVRVSKNSDPLRPLFDGVTLENIKEYAWLFPSTIAVGQLRSFSINGHEFFDLYGNAGEYLSLWNLKPNRICPAAAGTLLGGWPLNLWNPRGYWDVIDRGNSVSFRLVRTLPLKSP